MKTQNNIPQNNNNSNQAPNNEYSKLKIITTLDNTNTLYNNEFQEPYHSTFGALSESMHIFIDAGLNFCLKKTINVLEVGFGTGLNTILTYNEGLKKGLNINYTTIELFPVDLEIINQLNYFKFLPENIIDIYKNIHECRWNEKIELSNNFILTKVYADFNEYELKEIFDVIFFDAFAPEKQPSLWSEVIFSKLYNSLNNQGILTTYSSKGIVKTNLRNAGFIVTRLKGPIGKRHIIRATKNIL